MCIFTLHNLLSGYRLVYYLGNIKRVYTFDNEIRGAREGESSEPTLIFKTKLLYKHVLCVNLWAVWARWFIQLAPLVVPIRLPPFISNNWMWHYVPRQYHKCLLLWFIQSFWDGPLYHIGCFDGCITSSDNGFAALLHLNTFSFVHLYPARYSDQLN